MSFTVDSNHIPLFNGDFYAQVKVSATRNKSAKTFTVKVEGIRAYSKNGWNFGQRVTSWLGTDSSGSEMVRCPESGYASVGRSGSDTHTGWVPSSGYSNKISFSKTFSAKADGSCPAVYLFFEDYNPSVLYKNAEKYVPVYVSYTGDISSKVQNDAGGAFDVTKPTINTFTLTPTGTTSAELKLKTDYACNYSLYDSAGAELTSGETTKGTQISEAVTVKSESATYSVIVKRTDDSTLQAKKETTCDTRSISISSLSVTPVNSTSVNITVKADKAYKWEYKLPGTSIWKAGEENIAADTASSKTVTANSLDGTYTIRAIRTSCSSITDSDTDSCCNVPPAITEFSLSPNSSGTAKFTLKTSCACTYVLSGPSGTIKSGTVNTTEEITNQSINFNTKCDYTATVMRADMKNTFTASETATEIDTRMPVLNITDVISEGNQIKFKATATLDGSACTCHSWGVKLFNLDKNEEYTAVIANSGDATSINYTLSDCRVGEPLILSVEAKRKSNGAWESKDYPSAITCTGFAKLYEGSEHKDALCYIYEGRSWKIAVPYVYDGYRWHICD